MVTFLIFVFNRLRITRKQKGEIETINEEFNSKGVPVLQRVNNYIIAADGGEVIDFQGELFNAEHDTTKIIENHAFDYIGNIPVWD